MPQLHAWCKALLMVKHFMLMFSVECLMKLNAFAMKHHNAQ
jgi:hypothetical protein